MQILQIAFVSVLGVALAATLLSFLVLDTRQRLRTRRLRQRAQELQLAFSRDDRLDVPETYRPFAMLGCGHNERVRNVAHGLHDEISVRAFDLLFEAGHGARRTTRHYGVVVADLGHDAPECLVWRRQDRPDGPLSLLAAKGHAGDWSYQGDERTAHSLVETLGDAEEGLSVETRGHSLLLAVPSLEGPLVDHTAYIARTANLARQLGPCM